MLLEPIPSTNYDTKMIKTSTCSLITTLYVSLCCIAYAFPTNFITVLSTNARHITKGVCQGQRDIESSHKGESDMCTRWTRDTLCTWHIYMLWTRPVYFFTRVRRRLCKSTAVRKMRLCSTKEKSFKRRVESFWPKDISRKCKKASDKHHKHLNLLVFTLYL